MRRYKLARQISIVLFISIMLCEICLNEIPFKAYSFCDADGRITSSVRLHVNDVKQMVGRERLTGRSVTEGFLQRPSRRNFNFASRRTIIGLSFVDILPQMFHSTVFLRNNRVTHNTSGHMELIRCLYRKDGKKRTC